MAYGKISKKQSEILEYIKSQIINKGYPPSVRDICEAVNLLPSLPLIQEKKTEPYGSWKTC